MKTKFIFAAALVVAGCDITVDQIPAAVSQFNGDSVSIQMNGNLLNVAAQDVQQQAILRADAEATRICQQGQKKRAEFTSTRNIPTGQYSYAVERLYLCLN